MPSRLDRLRYRYGTYMLTVELNNTDKAYRITYDETKSSTAARKKIAYESIEVANEKVTLNDKELDKPIKTENALRNVHLMDLYSFPSPEILAAASETDLRALGMGYRAKFIIGTANQVTLLCLSRIFL